MRRFLTVDDDPTLATFVCTAIERLGVRVEASPTGADALRRLASGVWSGVLLDLNLPDVTGMDVLRRLRRDGNHVPVIVLTGSGSVPAAVEAMKLHALDFLEKPLRLAELTQAISRHMAVVGSHTPARHATELVARDLVGVVWASTDIPTVSAWAHLVSVSLPVLTTRCERTGVRPTRYLDLGRIVRTTLVRLATDLPLSEILACRDQRTVDDLLHRGGLAAGDLDHPDLLRIIERQQSVRDQFFIDEFRRHVERAERQQIQ